MLGLVYPKMMTNGGPDRVGHNCPTTPLELSSMKSKEKENNQWLVKKHVAFLSRFMDIDNKSLI